MKDVVAALAQGGLGAEVCDDVHEAISQALYGHPMRDALQQTHGVHIPSDVVHQLTCAIQPCSGLDGETSMQYSQLCGPTAMHCQYRS